ncbi:50S ribosomal protein L18 [Candidatus Woesearchaeota archaeon]|nr:50S ribosomal protein L18 [Candidatus Woesearchaeota archaeon]
MSKKHKPFRRKEKTDYHKRLSLLKSGMPRLVVRLSQKNISAQIVEYSPIGDKVMSAVTTKNLEKLGWKASKTNLPAAYLLGYLLAKKAKVKKAILDLGLKRSVPHSRVYALVKGVNDAGIEIPVDESMYPEEKRLNGEHIQLYAESLSKDKAAYDKKFSKYTKSGIKPETLQKHVAEIKSKIEGAK